MAKKTKSKVWRLTDYTMEYGVHPYTYIWRCNQMSDAFSHVASVHLYSIKLQHIPSLTKIYMYINAQKVEIIICL